MNASATTLLLHDADCVATFDDARLELRRASVFVRGGLIEAVGPAAELPQDADETIDARGHVVVPGLVNTHHHMFQSLTRAIPAVQDAELFSWLRGLYPIWAGLTPEMVRVSTQVAMAELLLSGCTTSSDHLYVYPNGVRLDDSIEAAQAAFAAEPYHSQLTEDRKVLFSETQACFVTEHTKIAPPA